MTETVDVSKLREGDVVTVRGVIARKDGKLAWVLTEPVEKPLYANILALAADIVSVEPRPLKVGDRVNVPKPYAHLDLEVFAISQDVAWVGGDAIVGRGLLLKLSELSPA